MKMKTKHFLFLAGGLAFGWWLVRRAKQKSTLSGLGESNPLVGQVPAWKLTNRRVRAWGSNSAPPLNRSVAPLVALDDVREPPIAKYRITDAGFGRY